VSARALPLLLLAAAVACNARAAPRLTAAPAAAEPGARLGHGFAHVVQVACDALRAGQPAPAQLALEAAQRLASVLDHAAPIPRPVQRREWIEAVRRELRGGGADAALVLLAGADERTLSDWVAPSGPALEGDAGDYAGAELIDTTGASIGRLLAVRGERAELRVGRETLQVPLATLVFGPRRGLVAAPQLNPRALRVCADPNNLPFSNQRAAGFENALAALIARELGAELQYTWWPGRRGALRQTLQAHRCDLVMGLPAGTARVLTSRPVYRSSYAVVTRRDTPRVSSLEAPELRELRIGVPLVGDDGANPPPVAALVARGLTANLRGYPVYSPPGALLRAVQQGELDVAVAWGPVAGYHASQLGLVATPLAGDDFAFDISLAVRRDDAALLAEVDRVLVARRGEIDALLERYRVPRL
jgi:mxaJ protein